MLLEYNDLTCVQLRAICKERGLKQSGVKKVVIDRLLGNDNNASAPSTSPQNNNDDDIGIILGSPTKVVATTELQIFKMKHTPASYSKVDPNTSLHPVYTLLPTINTAPLNTLTSTISSTPFGPTSLNASRYG